MDAVLEKVWTQEEFLLWAEAQDEPYEFDGIRPVLMTRPNNNHARLIRNLLNHLDRLLEPFCEVLGEVGIVTVRNAVRYPDVLVTCTPIDGRARTVAGPVVVFEVLSPNTIHNDRVVKVREYAEVPTIRRYVLVEQSAQAVTVLSRPEAGAAWTHGVLGEGEVLEMPEIGVVLPLSDLYARVTLDPTL